MIYRDDDINFTTGVAELAEFHVPFVRWQTIHTIAIECDLMDRNHAVNNWIKRHLGELSIQIHGWTHADYSLWQEDDVYADLVKCINFIKWKYDVTPTYFFPPWNVEGQAMRRAAQRAGLEFRNDRVEARDYLAGKRGSDVIQLHYWADLDHLNQIIAMSLSEESK